MGTQATWCIQCSPNGMTVDAVNLTVNYLEEFDYEGHTIAPRKRVPLGPDFQAELPKRLFATTNQECMSECELDSLRWLGERVWPMRETNLLDLEECGRAGLELQACSCNYPETLECVRLHINQKREALKAELGEAFSRWGFHEMGETVAEKWTNEEQLTFQELVRRNPESFWHDLFDFFPTRDMSDFVSYYFNVFVLRRRAIQNRINPDNIDSDDDEMVLESDERDSDSMLESDEELGNDADNDDDEEIGSMSSPERGSSGKELEDAETGTEESTESALMATSTHVQMASALQEPSCDGCCNASNVEDRNQTWELLAWDVTHVSTAPCSIERSDKEAWASPSLCSTQDELISTKGMMEEFFGSEGGQHSK